MIFLLFGPQDFVGSSCGEYLQFDGVTVFSEVWTGQHEGARFGASDKEWNLIQQSRPACHRCSKTCKEAYTLKILKQSLD